MAIFSNPAVAAIAGALVGTLATAIFGLIQVRRTEAHLKQKLRSEKAEAALAESYKAFLFGRDVMLWTHAKLKTNDLEVDRKRHQIEAYLQYFNIKGLQIPENPTAADGTAAAFLVSRNGLLSVGSATKDKVDEDNLVGLADVAGLPSRKAREPIDEYVQRLIGQGEGLLLMRQSAAPVD